MHPQSIIPPSAQPPAVSGIYRITNTVTGEAYIGSSVNVRRRWSRHLSALQWGRHPNPRLQAAFDADGPDALVVSLVECAAPDLLFSVEQRYLDSERPAYNRSPQAFGGPRLKSHSAQTRALISAKVRAAGKTDEHKQKLRTQLLRVRPPGGNPEQCRKNGAARKGRSHTPESIARMSAAQRGHPVSDETRRKIGDANRGRMRHAWTDEQRKRLSEAKRAWWQRQRDAAIQPGGDDGGASQGDAYRQLPLFGAEDCGWGRRSELGAE